MNKLYLFGSLALLAASIGCSSSGAPNSAEIQSRDTKMGADPSKAEAFLKQLEAVPPAERHAFVNQHPDDARNLGLVQDPAIRAEFQKIQRESR